MKTILKYLTIVAILVASPAGISTAAPLPRFRILVDTNQLNYSEIQSQDPQLGGAAVDGVWAITQNNCGLDCGPCGANPGYSQTNQDVPVNVPNVSNAWIYP